MTLVIGVLAVPSITLRIAVLGAGRIGSAIAFNLARNGHHDVTVIARAESDRFTQLRRDDGILDVHGKKANVSVSGRLDESLPFDLVIVTVLAHQVESILPELKQSCAKSILFMFNNFEPESLRDLIGSERCCFGMPFLQSDFDKDGRLNATIGVGGQKSIISEQRWVDMFVASGVPATLETNMLLWLRCHVPLGVAFESVSVLAVRRGGGASWTECIMLARGVHASFMLIQALGYSLYPSGKSWLNKSPDWIIASMLWSISRVAPFRDLLATGAAECRALIDAMVASAPRAKAPVRVDLIIAMRPEKLDQNFRMKFPLMVLMALINNNFNATI
jgi:2-dehydropantoate 2-reductase